jgi:hypothetical protein
VLGVGSLLAQQPVDFCVKVSSREKKEKLLLINSATRARKRNIRRQGLSQILNIYIILYNDNHYKLAIWVYY